MTVFKKNEFVVVNSGMSTDPSHGREGRLIEYEGKYALVAVDGPDRMVRCLAEHLQRPVGRETTLERSLRQELANYRGFIDRGGNRGSEVGRAYRERIGGMMARVHDERAKNLRVSEDDIDRAIAGVEVF